MRAASLNHTYRLVFDTLRQLWIPVAETARRRGKSGRTVLLAAGLLALASGAQALPTGGQVSAGSGSIAQDGSSLTVSQQSRNLALNWQSFGIGANESVTFVQPDRSAIALNRVLGQDASQILGTLQANGQVFILNPNGVVFGSGANVSVGGLLASTRSLSDSDFLNGNFTLSGSSTAGVSNAGHITAVEGGYVALVGAEVENSGSIVATKGNVSLAAGGQVTLQLDNGTLVGLTIDTGAVDALAANHGFVSASGGQVLLTAEAADALTRAVVNNSGVLEAQTVDGRSGVIRLLGDMQGGAVNVAGTLDASAPTGGNGGFVETSAATVVVADGTRVTTLAANGQSGEWLIDPADYTIAASGGNISGTTLTNSLANGSVTILSSSGTAGGSGDINVNDAVSWNANTLTLTAARDVNINAVMTAGDTAGLVMNTGTANGADSGVAGGTVNVGMNSSGFTGRVDFTGDANTLVINGNDYVIIQHTADAPGRTGASLSALRRTVGGYFALGRSLDISVLGGLYGPLNQYDYVNMRPVRFSGVFDGLGHTVDNLTINMPGVSGGVGFFGGTSSGSVIRNFGLNNVDITGDGWVGGLVGAQDQGYISNVFVTGKVTGDGWVGGLIGAGSAGADSRVTNAFANVNVTGEGWVGGLAGTGGSRTDYYKVYATGDVTTTGGGAAGGLFGTGPRSLDTAFATGNVSAPAAVGGLIGSGAFNVRNVYATGNVTGALQVGGLIGNFFGTLENAYSTGLVTYVYIPNVFGYDRQTYIGGLIGRNNGATITSSYWDTQSSGQLSSAGGTARNTQFMKLALGYEGWSMDTEGGADTVWRIYEGYTNPLLKEFMTPLAASSTAVYDGTTTFTVAPESVSWSLAPDASLLQGGTSAYVATASRNAGTYSGDNVSVSHDFWSTQLGYDIDFNQFTITRAPLTVTANDATRAAGQPDPEFTASYDGFVGGDEAGSLLGSLQFSTDATAASQPGTYDISLLGLEAENYDITYQDGTLTIVTAPDDGHDNGGGNDGVHGAQGNAWAYGHDNDNGRHCNNGGDVNTCNNGDSGHNIYVGNGGDAPGSNEAGSGSLMLLEEDGLRLPQGV